MAQVENLIHGDPEDGDVGRRCHALNKSAHGPPWQNENQPSLQLA
jgi:hypothetical protein